MSEEYSKKIIDFPDLRAAWTCGNCKYFIPHGNKQDPNQGECHYGPPVSVTVEEMIYDGTMKESALAPNAVKVKKVVPQIAWMFTMTSKMLVGCGMFQVKEKEN